MLTLSLFNILVRVNTEDKIALTIAGTLLAIMLLVVIIEFSQWLICQVKKHKVNKHKKKRKR